MSSPTPHGSEPLRDRAAEDQQHVPDTVRQPIEDQRHEPDTVRQPIEDQRHVPDTVREPAAATPMAPEPDPGPPHPTRDPGPEDTLEAPVVDRSAVLARQKERFGGIKVGSAFFGWLTATGMAVILLALLAAAGVGLGYATDTGLDEAVQQSENATGAARTVGLVGGILTLVVLLLAYFCGGYVAGRMARFNGAKQGLAVWVWGIVTALVVAALAAIAGSQFNIFAQLNLPRLPVDEGAVTATAVISIVAALLAALVGALLGGLAGMRFHRKVDAAGFDPTP